jgi:hypothetical protein
MSRLASAVSRAKSQSTGNNSSIADALDALEFASDGAMLVLSSVTQNPGMANTTSALVGAPAVLIPATFYDLLAGDKLIVEVVHSLLLDTTGAPGTIGIRALIGLAPVPAAFPPDFQSAFVAGGTHSSPGAGTWTFTAAVAGSYGVRIDWYVGDLANIATNDTNNPISLQISKVLG